MDTELEQHASKPHYAQSDFSVVLRALLDLGNRVLVHVNHVVEQMHRRPDGVLEMAPIDLVTSLRGLCEMGFEIDAAEIAGFIRKQWLLAAWIRRLDHCIVGRRVRPVRLIDEEQAWFTVAPGCLCDLF